MNKCYYRSGVRQIFCSQTKNKTVKYRQQLIIIYVVWPFWSFHSLYDVGRISKATFLIIRLWVEALRVVMILLTINFSLTMKSMCKWESYCKNNHTTTRFQLSFLPIWPGYYNVINTWKYTVISQVLVNLDDERIEEWTSHRGTGSFASGTFNQS